MSDFSQQRVRETPSRRQVLQKTLRYTEAQEHLLRRLGSAVVLQWDALPDELQDLIIDQASVVDDRDAAPHESRHIENFIRGVSVMSLSKPPSSAPQHNDTKDAVLEVDPTS